MSAFAFGCNLVSKWMAAGESEHGADCQRSRDTRPGRMEHQSVAREVVRVSAMNRGTFSFPAARSIHRKKISQIIASTGNKYGKVNLNT